MAKRFSYRNDLKVPRFADEGHVVFMDGACGLCSRSARALAKADTQNQFKIAVVQSPLGEAVLTHYGLDPSDPASWLYLRNGEALEGNDAIVAAAQTVSVLPRLLRFLSLVPRPIREAGYRFIARHRYKVMGRAQLCSMPDAALKARLL